MASRSIGAELVRFLHGVAAPVCLFDEDRRLVFANRACADWAAVSLDELIGRTASYTSATKDDGLAALDRLCPPPEAFAGRRQSGLIHAVSPDGMIRARRADFHPLDGGSGGPTAVLVLADARDNGAVCRELEPSALPTEVDDAHDRLVRFRHEQCSRFRLDWLLGDSPAMQLARSQARAAIASGANVTVVGPPGSGREHLARTVHYAAIDPERNPRDMASSNLLLPLDGSLLTGEVLAAAMGALSVQGRIAGATWLLLHVDRVATEMQAELVRVILQRFDGLRVLATSEVPPEELVAQGRLHAHLASAIGTVVIRLPPLAERRDDIPLVVQHLVEELNAERKKQLRGFSPEAIDALVAYSWPGNFTELSSFVNEAFARAEGTEITLADLPRRLAVAADVARRPPRSVEPIVLTEFLTNIERELIERALAKAKGNKARAARLLGLTRPRLYRRMVQLGLEEATLRKKPASMPPRRSAGPAARPKAARFFEQDERAAPAAGSTDDSDRATTIDEAEFIEDIPFEEQTE